MTQAPAFASSRPIIPPGTELNGIYAIDEPIAAGGMGEIYKGHAIQTGDLVAIKLIRPDLAEAATAFAMFRKEASALHNLYHEAIVRYYVFSVDPVLDRPYLAMEYVDGQSLSAMLRDGPLPVELVHRLMQRIAAGLHAAHEQGIVHRDVSPDNIIIPSGDMARAKIIDFGIARSTRLDDEGTIIGSGFAGKYNYVSPEQLGLYSGEVTPKSDIYSLGLVLVEALRGKPIDMGGNHVDVIEKRRIVPDLEGIDHRLLPLIEAMLQPDPKQRPASMAEVVAWPLDMAAAAASGKKPVSRTLSKKPQSPGFRRKQKLGLAAAGVFLLAGGAGFAVYTLTSPPPPLRIAPPPSLQASEADNLSSSHLRSADQILAKDPVKRERLAATLSGPNSEKDTIETERRDGQAGKAPARISKNSGVGLGLAPMDMALIPVKLANRPELLSEASDNTAKRTEVAALESFAANYDGGDCFFVKLRALSDRFAAFEGFGPSTQPFRGFDTAFLQNHGFEPDIGVRLVTANQCPVLGFVSHFHDHLKLTQFSLSGRTFSRGDTLTGTIFRTEGREISLWLIGDDGFLRDMGPLKLDQGPQALFQSFSVPLPADLNPGKLELLIAVESGKGGLGLKTGAPPVAASKALAQAQMDFDKPGKSFSLALQSFQVAP